MKQVIIPDYFFTDLLPLIDDMAELKLTLHCFWLLNEQSGELRYLRGDDLRSDEKLLTSLTQDNDLRAPKVVLEDALSRAVARNTLLRLEIETDLDGNVELPLKRRPPQPMTPRSTLVDRDRRRRLVFYEHGQGPADAGHDPPRQVGRGAGRAAAKRPAARGATQHFCDV
ncbi:MAG: hypothetical protein R2911_39850 [Caldilineaceae bacterium]